MPRFTSLAARVIGAVTLLALSLGAGLGVSAHGPAPAQQRQTIYLPLVRGAGQAPTTPITPTPTTPAPTPTTPAGPSGALLLGDKSYRSAGIALDKTGGMHAVFIRVAPFDAAGDPAPAYYAYCPPANLAACGGRAAWSLTPLEPWGYTHAQIELTPEGRPRLLLIGLTATPEGGFLPGHVFRYGECDEQCGTTAGWRFTTVLTSKSGGGLNETEYSYQSFELDPQGRPRFVYQDRASSSGAHRGAWYAFCDAACHTHTPDAPTWFETRIDNPDADYNLYLDEQTVLRFTPAGQPRVLAGNMDVAYVECNVSCGDGANWSRAAYLLSTGSGSSVFTWSLALDAHGRPRATIFPRGGPFLYTWCNDACASAESWEGYQLDFGQDSGAYSSLVLDPQGRPRVAYQDEVASLGYAWCDAGCEGDSAKWTSSRAEDGNAILADLNVPILPTCVKGGWFGGKRPVLALDAQGNPRIAYDAEFRMECKRYPSDPSSTLTFIETRWWTSRFVFFPQPR